MTENKILKDFLWSFAESLIDLLDIDDVTPLLEYVLMCNESDLQLFMIDVLTYFEYQIKFVNNGSESYICGVGKQPFLMVAHTDTVKPTPNKLLVTMSTNQYNNYSYYDPAPFLLSGKGGLGADDRAGIVAIILYLFAGLRPHIFLPSGEESGGLGTKAFIKNDLNVFADKINFMVQFDRQGSTDAVQYSDSNTSLIDIFTQEYFKKAIGSYTDISDLMPAYGISGVNLSIGYDKQHTTDETLDVSTFLSCIKSAYKTLTTMDLNVKHVYVKTVLPVLETKPFSDYDYRYQNWGSSFTPSSKTTYFTKEECELCNAVVDEVYPVDDIEVCKDCLHEPSNGLIENIYGFCASCCTYHTPNLANLFGKLALVVTQNDTAFSVACPECLEPLTEVNLDVKVSKSQTLKEFLLSKLKGFSNE